MTTLKGQNFRVLMLNATTHKYRVIGMSTNCQITLTNNVDDSSTKDDTGLAAKPVTTSKTWQVQVDSLKVSDIGNLLSYMKGQTPFYLLWDEVSTTDNQTPVDEGQDIYGGKAYLSDATFNFNDRENSATNLQFTGAAELETTVSPDTEIVGAGSYTKGQFVRLFLSSDNTAAPSAVIAACKQMSLHISLTMESATTKDTTGEWDVQEPTALNYDISTTALVRSGDTVTSAVAGKGLPEIETIYINGTPVKWKIANTSGANNRTASSTICSGSCLLTSLQISAQNRQNATYTAQMQGFGEYNVGN